MAEEVAAGIILINGINARALFNTSASYSFIDRLFAELHSIELIPTLHSGRVMVPNHTLDIREYCPNYPIRIGDLIMPADLLALRGLIREFDVVLGMNWLTRYYATIDCKSRTVLFRNLNIMRLCSGDVTVHCGADYFIHLS